MEQADPLDKRLLFRLYSFELLHAGDVNPGKLNFKIDTPSYSGVNDFSKLEDFMNSFYEYLEVTGLTDQKGMDRAPNLLALMLKDDAKAWFLAQRSIQMSNMTGWSLDQIVVGLRQRFVHTTAKSDALKMFENLRLGTGGVAELESSLIRTASYLVEKPSDYQMRSQFMKALPDAFDRALKRDGFNAEESTLDELILKASRIESAAQSAATSRARPEVVARKLADSDGKSARAIHFQGRDKDSRDRESWSNGRNNRTFENRTRTSYGSQDKPLPAAPSGGTDSSVNKAYATTPARPGAVFGPGKQEAGRVRGNAAAVEQDPHSEEQLDAADSHESTEPKPADDEYACLEYNAEDLELDDLQSSAWAENDTSDTYERIGWSKAGRIVQDEIEMSSSAAQTRAATQAKPETRYRLSAREVPGTMEQPKRATVSRRFFEGFMTIGGLKAYTLVDTGTDTDMVSAEFAQVSRIKTFRLDTPVGLQMACIGSRSRINNGTRVDIVIGKIAIKGKYFDVANIDRYDAIIGLPFLWQCKAKLDFDGPGTLTLLGVPFSLADSEFAMTATVNHQIGAPKSGQPGQTKKGNSGTEIASAAVRPE